MVRVCSILLLAPYFLSACGGEPPPFIPTGDTGPFDANLPDGAIYDAGMDSSDAEIPAECANDGPSVTIIAPTPATNADDENVLIGPRHTVSCDVVRPTSADSRPISPESVSISLVAADGSTIASPVVSSEGMTFSASFDLSEQANGLVRFRCVAEDTDGRCGDDQIETLLDLGPEIEIIAPAPFSVHASTMDLRYTVRAAGIAGGDTAAAVLSHTLIVAGVTITDITSEAEGQYSAAIDFADDTVFAEDLSGDFEIQIEATNSRTPRVSACSAAPSPWIEPRRSSSSSPRTTAS